jgi:hypothetical protein
LLGLGRSGGPTGPRCRARNSSAPDVSAPGRIEARRSRRSPNRIRRSRHSSRIARTKAPRGRWHSAHGRATRGGRGPCRAKSAAHLHGVVSPTHPARSREALGGRPCSSWGASPAPSLSLGDATYCRRCSGRAQKLYQCACGRPSLTTDTPCCGGNARWLVPSYPDRSASSSWPSCSWPHRPSARAGSF